MIGEDDVRYVAKLARLRLERDEVDRMTSELVKILGHIGYPTRAWPPDHAGPQLDHLELGRATVQFR